MRLTRYLPRSRPLNAWLLAVLLLTAQALGLAHRVAHAPGLGQGGAAVAVVPVVGHEGRQAHAQAFAAAGHEADTAECRLVDQLAHADGLCDAAWTAAPTRQASDANDAAPDASPRAGSASAYLARAPPLA